MSGGELFDYRYPNLDIADGRWMDEEINKLYHDLFCGDEFSVRSYGGLCLSLDFFLSGDSNEEDYRDAVARFKAKWFNRTPEDRVDFYKNKLQEYADKLKNELK